MDEDDGEQATRTKVEERCISTEKCGVRELKDRADQRGAYGNIGMRDTEFVEVTDMC